MHLLLLKVAYLGIYDVASQTCLTVNRVAEIVAEVKHIPLNELTIKHLPRWQGDADYCFPNSDKLRATGWMAKLNSEEAVRKAAEEIAEWVFSQ